MELIRQLPKGFAGNPAELVAGYILTPPQFGESFAGSFRCRLLFQESYQLWYAVGDNDIGVQCPKFAPCVLSIRGGPKPKLLSITMRVSRELIDFPARRVR